jgi:hypothetical protein
MSASIACFAVRAIRGTVTGASRLRLGRLPLSRHSVLARAACGAPQSLAGEWRPGAIVGIVFPTTDQEDRWPEPEAYPSFEARPAQEAGVSAVLW